VTSTESPPLSTGFPVSILTPDLRLFTLSDFKIGDDVIVHPGFKTEDAEKVFPKINIVKPYLRFTSLPKSETSANV
jgi:hypothetical protein